MVRPMISRVLAAALAALAIGLGGCDLGVRTDASQGIARFLDAVHAGDRAAFEATIDRPALRADLHRQIVDVGRVKGLDVGGPSEFALDRRITPRMFQLVEAKTGRALTAAPTAAQVALLMKVTDRSHVCVRDLHRDRCLLSFEKQQGVWRLVGMPVGELRIEVEPAPAKN
jgi:hypothetical protein